MNKEVSEKEALEALKKAEEERKAILEARNAEEYVLREKLRKQAERIALEKEAIAKKVRLEEKKRWYELSDNTIDITRVEILDTNNRYVMIPKLTDPHKLLKGDTDTDDDSLT